MVRHAILLLACACVEPKGFPCAGNDVCTLGGTQGICEPVGACSFPDPSCASGRRFGAQEGADRAGECVVEGDAGAPPDAPPLPPVNLVTNPSFETSLDGWDEFNATLTRVPGGHSGGFAASVCSTGAVDYTIDDFPATVPMVPPGRTYVASAWVRLPAGQATQTLTLKLRERDGSSRISEISLVADGEWRELRLAHTTSLTDADLDVFVGNLDTTGGCFEIDDVVLGEP